jgi:hypothetical protein
MGNEGSPEKQEHWFSTSQSHKIIGEALNEPTSDVHKMTGEEIPGICVG